VCNNAIALWLLKMSEHSPLKGDTILKLCQLCHMRLGIMDAQHCYRGLGGVLIEYVHPVLNFSREWLTLSLLTTATCAVPGAE